MEEDMYINTNLFSQHVFDVLNPMLKYMANSTSHYSWRYIGKHFVIKISPSDEIVFHTTNHSMYARYKNDLKTDIANIIKKIAIEHHGIWDRNIDSTFKLESYDRYGCVDKTYYISVKDIYFIYDYLKDRKNLNNKYDVEYIKEMIGEEADPITTEMRKTIAQEKLNIENEYKQKCEEIGHEFNEMVNEAYNKAREYRDNEFAKVEKERDEKLKELENNLANMKSFC